MLTPNKPLTKLKMPFFGKPHLQINQLLWDRQLKFKLSPVLMSVKSDKIRHLNFLHTPKLKFNSEILDLGFFFPHPLVNYKKPRPTISSLQPDTLVNGIGHSLDIDTPPYQTQLKKQTEPNLNLKLSIQYLPIHELAPVKFSKKPKHVLQPRLLPMPWTTAARNSGSSIDYRIPTVRFKPGLKKIWREVRVLFARISNIRAVRHVRITRFVCLVKALSGFAFIKNTALSAAFLIKQSGLVPYGYINLDLSMIFQNASAWSLNGNHLYNTSVQVYTGDFLINKAAWLKFPIRSSSMIYTNKLNNKNHTWHSPVYMTPAPWYLEVDELTASISVIAQPSNILDFDPALFKAKPFLTHRMLNWKYLT